MKGEFIWPWDWCDFRSWLALLHCFKDFKVYMSSLIGTPRQK